MTREKPARPRKAQAAAAKAAASPPARASRVDERYARPLFVLTIVTGSFLLFLTQPMIARMALPRIGGAPSVWNSAMLVYQLLLLAGYAYAHGLSYLRPRLQSGIHLGVLAIAALFLPIGLIAAVPPADVQPAFWVPWFLISSIGLLFFAVSAQAPLMQRWYALETSRGDPYPLYAASNLGSFAGLVSYPLLVEPLMTLQQQSWLWTGIYAVLVLLVAVCALTVPGDAVETVAEEEAEQAPPPTARQLLHWVALAAVPSGLMLSTTTHITTDIVAGPLLWVFPLGLYLLSFVIAFARRRAPADFITALAPLVILIAGGLVLSRGTQGPLYALTLGLLLLFAVAVALHSEMFRLRPAVGHLTKFYLAMSLGGMLGGLFCAILAPLIFDWAYEHPLLILAAAVLAPQFPIVPWRKGLEIAFYIALPGLALILAYVVFQVREGELTLSADGSVEPYFILAGSILISLLALACVGRRFVFVIALAALMFSYDDRATIKTSLAGNVRTRSYFGIYEVRDQPYASGPVRVLTHGTTVHGLQNLTPGRERIRTTYYAPRSGVGLALANAEALFGGHPRIGVVGLGSGTLSCYARPNQRWTFFEIDPAMIEVARTRFSFLRDCAPQARMALGDARLSLQREPQSSIDILAVDAFSSDAVPMHLLTREALAVYGNAVQRDGIVLFHISNRFLDLRPVIAELAGDGTWTATMMEYSPTPEEERDNATVSVWIALSRNPQTIERLKTLSGDDAVAWQTVERWPGFTGWTDDYASILPIMAFRSILRFGH